ncbi:toll/interleukin-1 receptor domain-containing protein [Mesorhizobium sp.]|uniref:toll/interleukin-1 receptor domain-containing protein n=1 Tax=Mesorhizobium sp. TaxID=1871066 RepID=UPI000FE76FE5|nr:toll/interleukin-1 receptor domain-containing protein [Mesorhizobium sp.]RWP09999.1 MAG: toll/interleukin-1 receptor domain-containing protein [Mesorhizobium sp.]
MGMRYKGRPFDSGDFAKDFEAAAVESIKEQLWERFSAIRHPDTGEFPTVLVLGAALDDLRLSIEGSPQLLALVRDKMSDNERESTVFLPLQKGSLKAFLSYSFDDRDLAETVARALMADGVDTWWAEWEIRSGDSLRRKIDEGLGNCTHFIVLLTPSAMQKPWVQQEMDAGLVRRISGQARFIALRYGVAARELPPLLSGMLSPELDSGRLDEGVRNLVNDIHGVTRKPQLGPAPIAAVQPATGYSMIATAIAKIFVEETSDAMFSHPQKGVDELATAIEATEEDIEDALHELRDLVSVSFGRVLPKEDLFATFDKYFMDWSPEDDALRIAADLINDPSMPHDTGQVAQRYGWEPRRMNPALAYLMARKLIVDYRVLSSQYNSMRVVKTDATRRFVKSRS